MDFLEIESENKAKTVNKSAFISYLANAMEKEIIDFVKINNIDIDKFNDLI